ncbi:hypothetical protein [Sphingomonas sp. 1P08PE]|uniref:hypothetical protein n=1 Tax=Sphingomonas sp. 1P08PE TaxID=554122 RepID=UPI0039A3D0D5
MATYNGIAKFIKVLLITMLIALTSISEPLIYDSAEAGYGTSELSCNGDWYWQGGQCVPTDLSPEILVYGHNGFDTDFFYRYITPLYDPSALDDFAALPSPYNQVARKDELNKRRRIHDCVADGIARAMEQDLPSLSTQREVTFEYMGVRARFDIVESVNGFPTGVTEIKTILDYEGASEDLLVRNQPIVAEGIVNGQAIPYGQNAALAGFTVGQPIGRPMKFAVATVNVASQCK